MASRIDHTNCSHPRTPAGRAACRRDRGVDADKPLGTPAIVAADKIMTAQENMRKANAKVTLVTKVEDLPKPKLTPAQLASPIIRSMMTPGVPTTVNDDHCTNCGRVTRGDDGYSGCCNEPVTFNCKPYADGGSCHH